MTQYIPYSIPILLLIPFLLRLARRSVRLSENHVMRLVAYTIDAASWYLGKFFYHRIAKRASLRRYSALQLANPSLRLLHIPGRAQFHIDLTSTYIPLRFDEGLIPVSQAEFKKRLFGGRFQVLGDPGSGKTSLIKNMFYELCSDNLTRSGDTCLPVFLELKNLELPESSTDDADAGELLLNQLRQQVERVATYDPSGLFESYLSGPGVIALLDGLDEVASDKYPRVADAIKLLSSLFASQGSGNTILITMRSQYHALVRDDLAEALPTVLSIQPFTPGDVHEFLRRFPFQTQPDAHIARIESNLASHPTLRELCFNPLILSMYVVEDQDDPYATVPDSRTSFYGRVTEELLVARRSRQLNLTQRSALRERREAILGSLAYANVLDLERPSNSIRFVDAIGEIKRILKIRTDASAEDALNELIRDTGIISLERRRESLRFIHLTFCEFLAAKYSVADGSDGWRELLESIEERSSSNGRAHTRLGELVPFAFALLPMQRRDDALQDVAHLDDLQMVAKCLLETQMYDHVVFARYVSQELTQLRESDPTTWDVKWRDRLHLLISVLAEARNSGQVNASLLLSTEEIYEEIISNDTEKVYNLFSSYVSQDAASAFRLADSVGVDLSRDAPVIVSTNCSSRPFVNIALQRLYTLDNDDRRRWAVLFAVGGLMDPAAAQVLNGYKPAPTLRTPPWLSTKRWGVLGVIFRSTKRDFIALLNYLLIQVLGGLLSRESLYTQCLGIAYQGKNEKGVDENWDEEIRSVLYDFRMLRSPRLFTPALLPMLLFGLISSWATDGMEVVILGILLSWVFLAAFILAVGLLYTDKRNVLYLNLTNLTDDVLGKPTGVTSWLLRRVHPIAVRWGRREVAGRHSRRRTRQAKSRGRSRRLKGPRVEPPTVGRRRRTY